jgi:hypothetical protein
MSAKCFSAIYRGILYSFVTKNRHPEKYLPLELQLSNLFCEIFFSVHDMETVGFTSNLVLLFEKAEL